MYQCSSSVFKSELLPTPSTFVYIGLNELSRAGAGYVVEDGVKDTVGAPSHKAF